MDWLIQIPILFFSIVVHEFSHGYMAYRRGDDTAYLSGRLTFNPLPHIDLFGTVLMPAMCYLSGLPMFGWAKPVPINPYRLYEPRKDIIKVAACGPLANIILALTAAVLLRIFISLFPLIGENFTVIAVKAMFFAININLVLAIFNLIPVAPLDGSQIVNGLLPFKWAQIYERHIPYGMWIILGLMITGLIRYMIIPPMKIALFLFAKIGLLPGIMM